MSNWDMSLESAMKEGVIATLYPVEMPLPMAAPEDLGRVGAELLSAPPTEERCVYVEGPQRYSSNDVAAAFAVALGRSVVAREISRAEWTSFLAAVELRPRRCCNGQQPIQLQEQRGRHDLRTNRQRWLSFLSRGMRG